MKFYNLYISFLIAIIAGLLFIPFIGSIHLFDWDEINFAECAREMIVSNDYLNIKINYQPFWEKPPLFIWFQALSMNVFGVNEFAARLPNAICGVITLVVLYNIGKRLYDTKFGVLWVLIYAGSFLPHFYFKSGIIDPWFNLFIFSGFYYFLASTSEMVSSDNNFKIVLSALFIGLAMLTKGPVALLVFLVSMFVLWGFKKFNSILSVSQLLIFFIISLSVGGLWFIIELFTGNIGVIIDFFNYQLRLLNTEDSGHGGPFFYHFIVLLIGCFPASIFALKAFKTYPNDSAYQKHFKLGMVILFCVVLFVFSVVKTKIVHYSSLCYFPLTFLATSVAYRMINGEMGWRSWVTSLLAFIGLLFGILFTLLPWVEKMKDKINFASFINDKFALGNLQANVHWNVFDFWIGPLFLLGLFYILFTRKTRNTQKNIIAIFVISLLTVNLASIVIVPKIEQYSQRAAIEFYESLQNKDCYVETVGYKSYAHLFYSRKMEQTNLNSNNVNWLLADSIDKPAYFVCKITEQNSIQTRYPLLEELYSKNGFVFYKRK